MPTIRIINRTSTDLNLALSHLCPIHFKNSIKPQEVWSVHVGSVWFTFEARADTTTNRYSVIQSAQSIGLISLTGASVALVAIPLTVTGLAPLLAPTTMVAQLASHNLLIAGTSPEVLQLTTMVAATLTKKTIHQLAIERGLDEDQLKPTLMTSNTLIDSLKYFAISRNLLTVTKQIATDGLDHVREKNKKTNPKEKQNALLGVLAGGLVDQGIKWWNRSGEIPHDGPVDHQGTSKQMKDTRPMSSRQSKLVHGIYIGFKDDYEFEWNDRLDDQTGEWIGYELKEVKLDQVLR